MLHKVIISSAICSSREGQGFIGVTDTRHASTPSQAPGLAPHADRPDVAYRVLAIDFLPGSDLKACLAQLANLLASARVLPLHHHAYKFKDAIIALRQFTHAQHIGKIVLQMSPPTNIDQQAQSCWAISGGLGALGLLTADWLAGQGPMHLLLLGRSGR